MKKKAVEKIPFLTLPAVCRKKQVEYVGVTAFKTIGHERHLFLEMYRNGRAHKDVPVCRIVLTGKDFGTYFPESGAWSRGRITKNTWSNNGLIWREDERRAGKTADILRKENILHSKKDMERIREACSGIPEWKVQEWWTYIDAKQDDIVTKESLTRRHRQWQLRQQALAERQGQTPALPKERILDYADTVIFNRIHYLYYKKHGAWAYVACSACGGVSDTRWKRGQSFESQMAEKLIEEPREGDYGTCPLCGAHGRFTPQGRVRGFYREKAYLFLGQKYRQTGMVFRYLEVGKEWQLELQAGEKEPEMVNACEKLDGIEIARCYFVPGEKPKKDYHKHDPYAGKDFWDDCNLSGNANIIIRDGWTMPETYINMEGTFLQYSALREYREKMGKMNPVDYLERYIQTPQIEMLVKMKLFHVVEELVSCHYGIVADAGADRVDVFLGIRKERVKKLIEMQGDNGILHVMQMEQRLNQKWTDGQMEQLAEIGIGTTRISNILQYMTLQKFLNRVEKYAGCEFGTMCSHASDRLSQTAQTYSDYLEMRRSLGYDMGSSTGLQPRDLRAAHDKMAAEQNRKEADRRLREVAKKYPLIKKNYRRLRKQFYFEDGDLLVRPARNAGEIVMEGRTLHHCVGGDTYLRKHNDGLATILFLRKRQQPEEPYITVEIDTGTLEIRQWYGEHDKKTDEKNVDRWLGRYTTRLKCQRDGTFSEAAGCAAAPLLNYA